MAAKGIQGPPSIQSLKDENLSHIFQYLTIPKDWYRATRVCWHWQRCCQEDSVKDRIMLEKFRRINSQLLQASPLFSWVEKSKNSIYPLEFHPIHSRWTCIKIRYESSVLKIHQTSSAAPFYCQLNERLLAISKSTLFFSSNEKQCGDRLILRDPKDLREITSVSLAEELTIRDKNTCSLLECFPVTDAKFITVSRGIVAQWELISNKLHRKGALKFFTKSCEHSCQINTAYRVRDLVFISINGEIDCTIINPEAAKYRMQDNTLGLDVKNFTLFDPREDLGRLAIASSDFLYGCKMGQLKAYYVNDEPDADLNQPPALILRWEQQQPLRYSINNRWYINEKEEDKSFQVNIRNAKDGTHFFQVKIPLQIPEDHPHHWQRDLLFYKRESRLLGDLLAVSFGSKIWLWHIPTKKQIGAVNLRNFFYVEGSQSAIQDVLLNENGLLILISHERMARIQYQIINLPYSNLPQPLLEDDAQPAPARVPISPRRRYDWLRPSYWWGLIFSGVRYFLRLFH
jgi:hypothetical protein